MWTWGALVACLVAGSGPAERINLADFGRVVAYETGADGKVSARELERGSDGWSAWEGPDGEWMIGVEWDLPRDLAEVNIEFRHAIADRKRIRVQYWRARGAAGDEVPRPLIDESDDGQWMNVDGEWWAGDRDISFEMRPVSASSAGGLSACCRTRRLRFLLGTDTLPPVRYLRAFAPYATAEAVLAVQYPHTAGPLKAEAVNGEILDTNDMRDASAMDGEQEMNLRVRYLQGGVMTPTRTVVKLNGPGEPEVAIVPDLVVQAGTLPVPGWGLWVRDVSPGDGHPPTSRPSALLDDPEAMKSEALRAAESAKGHGPVSVWLRGLLVFEDGRDLRLLCGAAPAWFGPGEGVRLRQAPTWFGGIDLEVRASDSGDAVTLELAGPSAGPPDRIVVDLRALGDVESVQVLAGPADRIEWSPEEVSIPGDAARVALRIKRR